MENVKMENVFAKVDGKVLLVTSVLVTTDASYMVSAKMALVSVLEDGMENTALLVSISL
jgi:hypothetical protein